MKDYYNRHSSLIRSLVAVICVVSLLFGSIAGVSRFLARKDGYERYSEFWDDPGAFDLWLFGASHMYYGIQPMELWENYGFTSYSIAAPSSTIVESYWLMMCALEKATPKMIVLDTYGIHHDTILPSEEKLAHIALDAVPLSARKVQAIRDLFDNKEERLEYLFPFYTYHNRWRALEMDDLFPEYSKTKQGQFKCKRYDVTNDPHLSKDEYLSADTRGTEYLYRIIEECGKRNIPLVLTAFPCCVSEKSLRGLNTARKIAEEHGVPFVETRYENMVVDEQLDFADPGHLNPSGSQKLTEFFGDYLAGTGILTDHRNDSPVALSWNGYYSEYLDYLSERMSKTKKLMPYLIWLRDDSFVCYIYRKSDKTSEIIGKYYDNIPNPVFISKSEAKKMLGQKITGDTVIIVQTKDGATIDTAVFKKTTRQYS